MLFVQWELGTLPTDPERLARIIGCSPAEFDKVWPAIREKFATVDGGLANMRLEQHRAKANELQDRHRRGAERTNAKRWRNPANDAADEKPQSGSLSDTLCGSTPSSDSGVLLTQDSRPRAARTRERPAYQDARKAPAFRPELDSAAVRRLDADAAA